MSYYTIFSTIFQRQNMNNQKIPEQHRTLVLFGDFSILSKLNRYLRSVLQGIHQAVIVVDGNVVDYSVPELFVKLEYTAIHKKLFKKHEKCRSIKLENIAHLY